MAVKLTKFDFEKPSEITSTEKMPYPWVQWLDGDIWQLTHGEDFHTHPLMMERIIRTRATSRGAKVRLRHQPLNGNDPFGLVIIQRTDVPGPAELKRAEAAEKRKAKKAAAEAEAQELVKTGVITPAKRAAKTPTKAPRHLPQKPVSKVPSKRPTKRAPAAA